MMHNQPETSNNSLEALQLQGKGAPQRELGHERRGEFTLAL